MDRAFLDWPFFENGAPAFWDEAVRWADETVPGLVDAQDERKEAVADSCRALVGAMGRAGLLAAATSLAAPLSARKLCLMRDALASRAALADFAFAMQGLGSGPISLYGSDAQKATYLPGVVAGDTLAAF
ncbi:acyl-CoA dehydrogenase family protein, partial [Rhodoplanes sp. SY1]|uniref:acyl-CoA dehydrogenase family protein n=1 Tax=Rhodoplanes sp. SY1 TaxID=3166646 RepID=UPI0038B5BD7B